MGYYVDLRSHPEIEWTRATLIERLRRAGADVHPEYGLPEFILPGSLGVLTLTRDPEARDGTWASIRLPTGSPTRATWEDLLAFAASLGGRVYDANLDAYVTLKNLDRALAEHRKLHSTVTDMFGDFPGEAPQARS
jgi:hypothetical protein